MRRPLPPVPPVPRAHVTALAVAVLVAVIGSLLVVLPGLVGEPDREPPGVGTVGAVPACTDALLVAVPGAGEVAAGSTDPGTTLAAYAEPLVAGAEAIGRSVTTRVVAADTLAPGALRGQGTRRTPAEKAVTRAAWQTWRAPVPGLVSAIETAIDDAVEACPDQLLHLVGYSQGAEAIHRYVGTRADSSVDKRTVAVLLVGNPARVAGSRDRLSGGPAAPRRAEGVSARKARRPAAAVPAPELAFAGLLGLHPRRCRV